MRRPQWTVAAVVVTTLCGASMAAACGPTDQPLPTKPGHTSEPAARASTTWTAYPPPSGEIRASDAGLTVLSGDQITRADGSVVSLGLPRGHRAYAPRRVADGWLIQAAPADGPPVLFFTPDGGKARVVATRPYGFAVAGDGRTVVAAGPDENSLAVYTMPDLTLGRTVALTGGQPAVVDATADWALIRYVTIDPMMSRAYVWNLHTGELIATDAVVDVIGLTPDGSVLRRMAVAGRNDRYWGCLDLVPAPEFGSVTTSGTCSSRLGEARQPGRISPRGTWATVTLAGRLAVVRAEDLRASRWAPRELNLGPDPASQFLVGRSVLFWDTERTFVVAVSTSDPASTRYFRCDVESGCTLIVLPPNLTAPILVEPVL